MANRFLKTAGGTWSSASTWSATGSGGADSVGPPTAADDCILEASSGALTIDTGAVCRSLNMTSGTGSYTGTVTHTAGVTLTIGDATAGAGNVALKFNSGMTYTRGSTSTCIIAFVSTNATVQTITTATRSQGGWTFNGAGGSWQLLDTSALGGGSTLTLTAGTLDTNGTTCNWQLFASAGAGTRTLTLGASPVGVTGTAVNAWNVTSTLTLNPGGSTITMSGAGTTFIGGGLTYNNVTITASGATPVTGANTYNTFNRTATATTTDSISFSANQTATNLTLAGNSTTNRLFVQSSVNGTARTITSTNAPTLTNVNFMDITAGGTAWTGTSLGDCQGNTNITFDAPVSRFAVVAGVWSSTATWGTSSGSAGGASVPLPQDSVTFDANSPVGTYQCDLPRGCKDLTCTGFTGTLNLSLSTAVSYFGSLTLASGMTVLASNALTLSGRGSQTITCATKTIPAQVTCTAPGGTYTLQDNFSCTSLILSFGTLTCNTFNVTIVSFASNFTTTRALNMGSGTWKLTGVTTVWALGNTGSLTITPSSSIIMITDTSTTGKTFTNASVPLNILVVNSPVDSAKVTITGGVFNQLIYRDARMANNNYASVGVGDGMSVSEKIR